MSDNKYYAIKDWAAFWLAIWAILFSIYAWAYLYAGGTGIRDILVSLLPSLSPNATTIVRIVGLISLAGMFLIPIGLITHIAKSYIRKEPKQKEPAQRDSDILREISTKLDNISIPIIKTEILASVNDIMKTHSALMSKYLEVINKLEHNSDDSNLA